MLLHVYLLTELDASSFDFKLLLIAFAVFDV